MADWAEKLDGFLRFNEYDVLDHAGTISAEAARKKAEDEYAKFRTVQDVAFKSDFDEMISEVQSTGDLPKRRRIKKPLN